MNKGHVDKKVQMMRNGDGEKGLFNPWRIWYSQKIKAFSLRVKVNLPTAGRDASFVAGLCHRSLNLYTSPLPLNQTGLLTLTITYCQFLWFMPTGRLG